MPFRPKPFALPLALAVSFSWVGCRLTGSNDIWPSEGATDVKVNTMIRARFKSPKEIRKADLNSNRFALSECTGDATTTPTPSTPSAPASAGTAGTNAASTGTDGESPVKAVSRGRPVEGRLLAKTEKIQSNSADGKSQGTEIQTDIFFIPVSASWEEPPLKEGTTYCFSTTDLRDIDGNILTGKSTSFTTEEATTFQFNDAPDHAKWLRPEGEENEGKLELSTNELLIVEFDTPVHPNDVLNGFKVCNGGIVKDATESDNSLCAGSGIEGSRSVVLLEDLTPKEGSEGENLEASFTRYGVGRYFQDGNQYKVQLGFGDAGASVEELVPVSFEPPIEFLAKKSKKAAAVESQLNPAKPKNVLIIPLTKSNSRGSGKSGQSVLR